MNKLCLILLFFSLFASSCTKEPLDIPIKVKELIVNMNDCICDPFINKYTWDNQTVYVLAYKGPACDTMPRYYNATGEEIKMATGYLHGRFLEESHLIKNVWACPDSI